MDASPGRPALGAPPVAPVAVPEAQRAAPASTLTRLPVGQLEDEAVGDEWRRQLGKVVTDSQQRIDANLSLFRVACLLTMAGSLVAAVRFSGLLHRFNSVDDIPLGHFLRRKKLRVRLIRQSKDDPSVFYVYHTPFVRRVLLKDTLPSDTSALVGREQPKTLLAVRPFGVQVDESAEEWIWANFVSPHHDMTIQLLHRWAMPEGSQSVATCGMILHKPPLGRDFGEELMSHGYAECMPESMHNYDNGVASDLPTLSKRLERLEAAQKSAQAMQYGIWRDWQAEKLSDRVMSAGKRATANGLRKLLGKIR